MRLPRLAIDNYQFTILVFIILIITGVSSYFTMPRTENPEMTVPGGSVIVIYPGANPMDLEQLVTIPLEEAINELDDIKKITTGLRDGIAIISVEFDFNTIAKDKYDELVQKVNTVAPELPDEIYSLETLEWKSGDVSMLQLALISDSAEYSLLENEADKLKKRINNIPGIRKVDILACPEQEVRVALDIETMAQMGIDIKQVAGVIMSNNANIPGGSIKLQGKNFGIKTSGSFENIEELKNTVVHSYMGKNIYLKNIADVFYAYEDNNYYVRFNKQRGIFISIMQKEGLNIFQIMERIQPELEIFSAELDPGIQVETVFNQANEVDEEINGFLKNLLQGIALVGLVILLALGLRSSLIVITAIPLSILIGLAFLNINGYGLQQISIAGLVVSLGLLVDNSIVMVENINRFLSLGYNRREASIKGASEIAWPVVSATATTVFAFIPIITMPDKAGAFIKSMPVIIIATLIVSMFIALTLTPLITSKLFKDKPKDQNTNTIAKRNGFVKTLRSIIEGPYRRILNYVMNHRWLTLLVAIALLLFSSLLFPSVGFSLFPKAEKPQFMIRVNMPEGTHIDKTDSVAHFVESVLDTIDQVDFYATNVGHGNPRIYYNEMPENYNAGHAEIFIQLKEYRKTRFDSLITALRNFFKGYAGARIDLREFTQGVPVDAPIMVYITGTDIKTLQDISKEVEQLIREQPGAISIDNALAKSRMDLHYAINKDKANMYGVPLLDIDRAIRTAMAGAPVSTYRDKDGKDFNIVLRLPTDERNNQTLADFDKIYVKSLAGKMVPLKQLGKIEFKKAPSIISRYNLERTALITADLEKGANLDEIMKPVIEEMNNSPFPNGYGYYIGGELESRSDTFGGMGTALLIAIISIFAVLVLQFRSFKQPLIIFISFPLGAIGVLWALFLSGNSFSFTAFIGFISLAGIVINNAIILVDYTNLLIKGGKPMIEAIKIASETRFIPIVLTTLTTIGGLLPLTLGGGSMWAPMGWTIIGGLLVSTFLTLLVVPVLYGMMTKEQVLT